jgi:branched-chain amino acid transport system substrate-binding protein
MRRTTQPGRAGAGGARWRVLAIAMAGAAVALAGCQLPARLGQASQVVAVTGRCDSSAVVEVGAAVPLSGALAPVGQAELTGLELGVHQVNDGGGVLASHRCLELVYKDDESNAAVDDQALLDLVNQERVAMVVGPFLALNLAGDRAQLGSLGTTATTFSAVAAAFHPNGYPYTFPLGPSASVEGRVLAAFAGRQKWRRIAVLDSGSAASTEAAAAFASAAQRTHATVRRTAGAVDSGASARAALGTVRTSRPDVLVVFDDGSTLAPVLVARHELGWEVPVLGASTADVPSLPPGDLAGVDMLEPSALSVAGGVPPSLASLRTKLRTALGGRALRGSLAPYGQGYDAIEMFANAVTGVNADDPGSLRTYLENANYQGVLGSYAYSAGLHGGFDGGDETVVPLGSLVDGVFVTHHRRATSSERPPPA